MKRKLFAHGLNTTTQHANKVLSQIPSNNPTNHWLHATFYRCGQLQIVVSCTCFPLVLSCCLMVLVPVLEFYIGKDSCSSKFLGGLVSSNPPSLSYAYYNLGLVSLWGYWSALYMMIKHTVLPEYFPPFFFLLTSFHFLKTLLKCVDFFFFEETQGLCVCMYKNTNCAEELRGNAI